MGFMKWIRAARARVGGLLRRFTRRRRSSRGAARAHRHGDGREHPARHGSGRGATAGVAGIRRRDAGGRGGARPARVAVGRRDRVRHQVRRAIAAAQPRFRRRRHHDARTRHRRQHGDLQRRPGGAAQAPAPQRRRPSRLSTPVDGRSGRREPQLLRPGDQRLPRRREIARRNRRVLRLVDHDAHRPRGRAGLGRPRDRQLFRGDGPLARARPSHAAERRRPRRARGDGADPRVLDEALRRR